MSKKSEQVAQWRKNNPEKFALQLERRKQRLRENPEQQRAIHQRFKEKHPEYHRVKKYSAIRQLKQKYGLTLEEKQQMFDSQEGRCEICNITFVDLSDAKVDHDHITGQNRSLLCSHCNLAIGHAREDAKTLRRMAEYLEYWTAQE